MRGFRTVNFGLTWVLIKATLRAHLNHKPDRYWLSSTTNYNKNRCFNHINRYVNRQSTFFRQSKTRQHALTLTQRLRELTGAGVAMACFPGIVETADSGQVTTAEPMGLFSSLTEMTSFSFGSAPQFIAEVVRVCQPSVVFVEARGKHRKTGNNVQLASGSGFIVKSEDSYSLVLTTAHVVGTRSHVTVKLADGSTLDAHVCVVDQVKDLAVLAVQPKKKLPVIKLAPMSNIRPGEFVAAMGSPMALHKTVTQGIISSSPLRPSTELGMKDGLNLIQTDAVIWEGNFGGPMVNMEGSAIGVNAIMLTEGIAFAIPTDYAVKLINTATQTVAREQQKKGFSTPIFQNDGSVVQKKRYMGISMVDLDQQMIMELKEKQAEFPNIRSGIYVHTVNVSSPAYKAGMHAGDVIVEINGESMDTAADVYRLVESSDFMNVKIIRGKSYRSLRVATEKVESDG